MAVSERFGAVWGEMRDGSEGYFKYYESNLDDIDPFIEYETLSPKEQLVKNAKAWASKKFYNLDQEEVEQEIDIKAWLLEESGEFDYETNDWVRPQFVFTAIKNHVIDYSRKELGFKQNTESEPEVEQYVTQRFAGPGEEFSLTFKTAKAAILLVVNNETLPLMLEEQVKELLSLMTEAEKAAVLAYAESGEHVKRVATDRAIKRVMKVVGYDLAKRTIQENKNHEAVLVSEAPEFPVHTITPGTNKSRSYVESQGSEEASESMETVVLNGIESEEWYQRMLVGLPELEPEW